MTPDELSAIRARLAGPTPGPWTWRTTDIERLLAEVERLGALAEKWEYECCNAIDINFKLNEEIAALKQSSGRGGRIFPEEMTQQKAAVLEAKRKANEAYQDFIAEVRKRVEHSEAAWDEGMR